MLIDLPGHPEQLAVVGEFDDFIVVDYTRHVLRHKNYPRGARRDSYSIRETTADIKYVVYHQTAGNYLRAPQGIDASARYIRDVRGWPSLPYHLYIPYEPVYWNRLGGGVCGDWYEGVPVIYWLNPFQIRTWHTKGGNSYGIGVVFQGKFDKKEGCWGGENQPSEAQRTIAERLWTDFLRPGLGLDKSGLRGHADFSKPACPGGNLMGLIKRLRTGAIEDKEDSFR